jgi:hypothetical protein
MYQSQHLNNQDKFFKTRQNKVSNRNLFGFKNKKYLSLNQPMLSMSRSYFLIFLIFITRNYSFPAGIFVSNFSVIDCNRADISEMQA